MREDRLVAFGNTIRVKKTPHTTEALFTPQGTASSMVPKLALIIVPACIALGNKSTAVIPFFLACILRIKTA
jgi:hypothetical protein